MSVEFKVEGRFLKWEVRAYRDGVLFYKLRDTYITRLGAESASSYCSRVYMDAQRTEKENTNGTLRTLLQSVIKSHKTSRPEFRKACGIEDGRTDKLTREVRGELPHR